MIFVRKHSCQSANKKACSIGFKDFVRILYITSVASTPLDGRTSPPHPQKTQIMPSPTHPDAHGYIIDLKNEINAPWFNEIVDQVIIHRRVEFDDIGKKRAMELFQRQTTSAAAATSVPVVPPIPIQSIHFTKIAQFNNFKLLPNTLELKLEKRINIIYGRNGSGKTSLCDAFKILVNRDRPRKPLHNVRVPSVAKPSFSIFLKNQPSPTTWTEGSAFGVHATHVKYFDSEIAGINVMNSVEPGRVIELSPFKLNSIDSLRGLVSSLRNALAEHNNGIESNLRQIIQRVFPSLGTAGELIFPNRSISTSEKIEMAIANGKSYPGDNELNAKISEATALEKATSEDGIKLLNAEVANLERIFRSLNNVREHATDIWKLNPGTVTSKIDELTEQQNLLSKSVLPDGISASVFIPFLKAATAVYKLEAYDEDSECPMCRQAIGIDGKILFNEYHKILMDTTENELRKLKAIQATIGEHITKANESMLYDIADIQVEENLRSRYSRTTNAVVSQLSSTVNITEAVSIEITALTELLNLVRQIRDQKRTAIDLASIGLDEPKKALVKIRIEIARLQELKAQNAALTDLSNALTHSNWLDFYRESLPLITPILTKISRIRSAAHSELILGSFEKRLNDEYLILAERNMADLGVRITPRTTPGDLSEIVVDAQIGPDSGRSRANLKALPEVLSEGEQRLHALALFFAELESSNHSVIIFDDPVSSFDYNHSDNFCLRLRNFINKHTTKQVIVLTHHWEFFIQLQSKIKFVTDKSIQVLESCSTVDEYTENLAELHATIQRVLAMPNEPINAEKGKLAGNMRRLIEAVVNHYVFNKQRHQFKCKDVQVSVFREFTKVAPLLPQEATTLSDLFSKLSVSEHDDPRSNIMNTTKAVYATRYASIQAIEAAIIARIPP